MTLLRPGKPHSRVIPRHSGGSLSVATSACLAHRSPTARELTSCELVWVSLIVLVRHPMSMNITGYKKAPAGSSTR